MTTQLFTSWLQELDALCQKSMGGLGLDDLPEIPAREFWRDGIMPSDAFYTFMSEYWGMLE